MADFQKYSSSIVVPPVCFQQAGITIQSHKVFDRYEGVAMSSKTAIATTNAPAAVGPYSQGIAAGNLIFVSGQLPLDAQTKEMPATTEEQAKKCLNNLKAVLEEGGSSLDKVVKTTVFLADINDFAAFNAVYATYFTAPFPARSCFAVKDLPLGATMEIEAFALA